MAGLLKYLQDQPQYYNSSPEDKRGFCTIADRGLHGKPNMIG